VTAAKSRGVSEAARARGRRRVPGSMVPLRSRARAFVPRTGNPAIGVVSRSDAGSGGHHRQHLAALGAGRISILGWLATMAIGYELRHALTAPASRPGPVVDHPRTDLTPTEAHQSRDGSGGLPAALISSIRRNAGGGRTRAGRRFEAAAADYE